MKLKRIGFFRELDHGDPTGPILTELVNDKFQPDEQIVLDYLRNGLLLIGCPGMVGDVLDKSAGPIGSPDIMTDGTWAWPGDLPFYVERYHLTLPAEFIDHVRGRRLEPLAIGEVELSDLEL